MFSRTIKLFAAVALLSSCAHAVARPVQDKPTLTDEQRRAIAAIYASPVDTDIVLTCDDGDDILVPDFLHADTASLLAAAEAALLRLAQRRVPTVIALTQAARRDHSVVVTDGIITYAASSR